MKIAFIQRKAEIEIQMKKELMQFQSQIKIQETREPEKEPCSGNCGENHCDTNGCAERERFLVEDYESCIYCDGRGVCEGDDGKTAPCRNCNGRGKIGL